MTVGRILKRRRSSAALVALGALLAAGLDAPAQAAPAPLQLNVAIGAAATATTEASGSPASNAVDGSAETPWCSSEWTGTLTVDLGRARRLGGLGMTLGPQSQTALVNVSYATRPGGPYHPLPDAYLSSWPANDPAYVAGAFKARLVQVQVTDNDGTPPCIQELRLYGAGSRTSITQLGADLSFEPQEEALGATFSDSGVAAPAMQILQNHGLNYVRLRLWINPPAGYPDLPLDLQMARRIHDAGLGLYLDLHYSDFWADPQHQDTPADWVGQPLPQLADTVQSYTRDVIAAFAAQGTPVDMVSIGNEIRHGILWPVGQVDDSTDANWDSLGTLLRAGVAGARAGNPAHHKLLVMLHYDQGGDNAATVAFFDRIMAQHVPFDVLGLSYYSVFHGPLTGFRDNVNDLAARYGKKIVVAESQYPWTLANGDSLGNFLWNPSQLSPGYPASPGGQVSMYSDLLSILSQVPHHLGYGFFYWEPEWIPGLGWEPGAGTPNDNLTLFSFTGRALPSVGIFESPLAVCARYATTTPCEVPNGAS
jgi:arabinogalactan endo-1,4-beta-galactosidase